MAEELDRSRIDRLRQYRLIAIVVAIVSLLLCCPWFVFLGQWLNYDRSRPEDEQPFFKDLGLMVRLWEYLPVLLISVLLLIGAVAWARRLHWQIQDELALNRTTPSGAHR